ncbi:MAG TPA: DUF998 domain-containing protein [Candidatus Hydrogenedentes bacterium]|jgi:hypothetical membrane protein|nr:MAG: hypothetical protein BWY07_02033 [Candidatus Hydrogenedentes bacterium ADurb.Bin170]HNZ49117.1 DUF998 domain-containing protein [Candidatus Hydrogenedentota bacterium]HOD96024.1 DUF998 domain-containing protein [Candidatus Hydrogenedentota bacterium]HOM47358.1 DUF998 domain-containing protein [Candidatus Hydrogenedentota bacterium]HOR51529.1 DUF998 domain-containing protein [Candidatus Hydrogenedentota bacterium]
MNTVLSCLCGRFDRRSIKIYLASMSVLFWSLIFLAWLGYPTEHKYSIMTHTFSFLGSYDPQHSPVWWWLFTVALILWGMTTIPLVFYIHRHFSELSTAGAHTGAACLLTGAVCIMLVGIFPDVKTPLTSTLRVTDVHEKVALLAAAGFILGNFTHGFLLLKDRFSGRQNLFVHRYFAVLYGIWLSILFTASYFLIKWEFVYAQMKAAAQATGQPIGSSWSEAMNTIYSFPLWENILIYSFFVFLVSKTLILSSDGPAVED